MEIKTNIKDNKLVNDFSEELLDGQIQIASNKGYPSKKYHKQEDSVGSVVKNKDCFLNIVADGLGGSKNGEFASKYIVEKLIEWFINTNEEDLYNIEKVKKELKKEIRKINRQVFFKSRGSAQTTLALSLTNPYKTLIINVGDSTVYTYDNEELKLLTYIKFHLLNKSYEQIRKDIFGFLVTSTIGDYPLPKIYSKIIENEGQRLILSTDGVTDLISEERFTNYFINKTKAKDIVDDALTNPDVIYKSEDNISAITVELPNNKVKKLNIIN